MLTLHKRKFATLLTAGALAIASSLSMTGVAHAATQFDYISLNQNMGGYVVGCANVLDNDTNAGYLVSAGSESSAIVDFSPDGTVCVTRSLFYYEPVYGWYVTSTDEVEGFYADM